VDGVLATVRSTHSGAGGPLGAATVSSRSFDDGGLGSKLDDVMINLDRMNLLRIAAGKIPYALPLKSGYRFTSGFGYRRDPKVGGRRMHAGIDMAAAKGTPIYATADGVVVSSGTESGYGRVVRIRHEFGFETVYAHQTKLLVEKGQKVSRGEHIGDMGSTGRSTGVHLHYEVHLNGRPVNPMIYLEAAKDVL
jgi:murein DD-endopeptidase MepM/ murein hydrolase activator NlpD